MDKERMRKAQLNMLKIKTLEEKEKNFRNKPRIGADSSLHWNQRKMKKQLSSSVFQRF